MQHASSESHRNVSSCNRCQRIGLGTHTFRSGDYSCPATQEAGQSVYCQRRSLGAWLLHSVPLKTGHSRWAQSGPNHPAVISANTAQNAIYTGFTSKRTRCLTAHSSQLTAAQSGSRHQSNTYTIKINRMTDTCTLTTPSTNTTSLQTQHYPNHAA